MTKIDDAGSPVVDVAYKTAAGETRVMPWNDLDPLAVADGSPYREFPWYLGQRNYSGMYWCATEVKLVGYESLLELSRLLMADFDRSAKRIVSQPFQIKANIDGGRLTRIPDYLVLGEVEPLVIDVTRKARMDNPKYARLFGLTRRIVESRGWKYELAYEPPKTEYLNIRFLAGYRRPWLFDDSVVSEVRHAAVSAPGSTISDIACGTRYPKRTALPALMHLLWRQDLTAELTERLSPWTVIGARS
jgi:hypothetical protein